MHVCAGIFLEIKLMSGGQIGTSKVGGTFSSRLVCALQSTKLLALSQQIANQVDHARSTL